MNEDEIWRQGLLRLLAENGDPNSIEASWDDVFSKINGNSKGVLGRVANSKLGNFLSKNGAGIGMVLNQIGTDIADYQQLADTTNLGNYKNQLRGMNNSIWGADFGSSEDIMQANAFANPNSAEYSYEGKDTGQIIAGIGKDALSGAAIGTSFMPGIGTAIGAVAGLVGGTLKQGFGRWQADKRYAAAEKAYDKALLDRSKALHYGIDTYNTKNNMLQDFNYADMGGPINHGTHWPDNITLVDNGGTHEANPFGGVLMGVDQEGTPNLVEEGEVIWNDYVFSNRLKVPKALREKYNLKKDGGPLTFAEGVKASRQFKALEEMPNDKITKDTFNAFIGEMAMAQEELRMKDAAKQQANRFDWGGFINALNQYKYSTQKGGIAGTYKIDPNMHKPLGFNTIKDLEDSQMYQNFTNYVLNNSDNENVLNYLRALDAGTHPGVKKLFDSEGNLNKGWKDLYNKRRYDQKGGIYHFSGLDRADLAKLMYLNNEPVNIPSVDVSLEPDAVDMSSIDEYINNSNPFGPASDTNPDKNKGKGDLSFLRYAPLFGNATALLDNIINPIDYSNIERYENYALGIPMATTHPIGNYTEYRPFDINYAANRAAAQSANRRRLISDLSGGNAASARANLVANDYAANNEVGNLLLAAADSNLKQRQFRDTFNRETDKYNSEDAFRTQNTNVGIWNTKLNALMRGAAEREHLDSRYSQAASANRTALFENLGNLGREEFIFNQLDNPALMYEYARGILGNRSGQVSYKSGSKGGLLTVKRKGRK